jgi:hypothetical protein
MTGGRQVFALAPYGNDKRILLPISSGHLSAKRGSIVFCSTSRRTDRGIVPSAISPCCPPSHAGCEGWVPGRRRAESPDGGLAPRIPNPLHARESARPSPVAAGLVVPRWSPAAGDPPGAPAFAPQRADVAERTSGLWRRTRGATTRGLV